MATVEVEGNYVGFGSLGNSYYACIEYTTERIGDTTFRVYYSLECRVTSNEVITDTASTGDTWGDLVADEYYPNTPWGSTYFCVYEEGYKDFSRQSSAYEVSQTLVVSSLAESQGGGAASTVTAYIWVPGTTITAPAEPEPPTITNIAQTTATINMKLPYDGGAAIEDTAAYCFKASNNQLVWSDGHVGADVIFGVTGLNAVTQYYSRVSAYNSAGWSLASDDTYFTTLPYPPVLGAAPDAINVARSSFEIPTATIVNNGGQTPYKYRVQFNTSPSEAGATVTEVASWSPVIAHSLTALTTYYYRVAGYNNGGWGDYSASWNSVTTLTTVPDDPAAPTFTNITDTSVTVNWVEPNLNDATLTDYVMRVCTSNDPNNYVQTFTVDAAITSKAVTGLTKGTAYQVFVKALASPANSGWSIAGTFTTTGTLSTLYPYLKVAGVWLPVEIYKNTGGTWSRVLAALKSDGVWKKEAE